MAFQDSQVTRNATLLRFLLASTSVVVAAGMAVPAIAQSDAQGATQTPSEATPDVDPNDAKTIVVTGIRKSLQDALSVKRRATNQVDSISAEEAGKFPDNNLAESLQRVPGVTVSRSQFNGSGEQISVRGLGPDFTNVLLNGRSMPSDTGQWCGDYCGSSRAFNFDVLPSEMISRVDINKTMLPGLTEGGIGATVNIITPRPLDTGKTFVSFSAAGNYVERRNKITPTLTGILSWVNPAETLGVSVAASYTDMLTSRDYYRVEQWENVGTRQNREFFTPTGESLGFPTVARQEAFGRITGGGKRIFGSATVQFKPSDDLTVTLDGLYSRLKQVQPDSIVDANFGNVIENPTFASDGVLTEGVFPGLGSASLYTVIRERDRTAKNYALGFNTRWNASPDFDVDLDLSYANSYGTKAFDPYFRIGRPPEAGVKWSLPGEDPVVEFDDPVFSDPSLVRVGYTGNWGQTIKDDIYEASLTGRWKVDRGALKSVVGGLNYQDHTKRLLDYYANTFDTPENPYCGSPNGCYYLPVDPGLLSQATFGSNFMNGLGAPPVTNYLTYDPREMMAWLCEPAQVARANKPLEPGFGCYYDLKYSHSFGITERVSAGYVDTNWGGDHWSGNIGVRVVHVQNNSIGEIRPITAFLVNPDGTYQFVRGPAENQSHRGSYWSILPSANFTYRFTDNIQLRLGASRSLSRGNLGDLRYFEDWGGSQGSLRLNTGNPGLKPQYSKNLDASLEWYISSLSYMAVAGFYKDISNLYGQKTTTGVTIPGAPEPVAVTTPVNVANGKVRGVELAGQFSLGDAVRFLNGFGVSANYTHVRTTRSDASSCGVNGVSPDSYNVGGFYDDGRFMLRAAYNWRSKWLQTCDWDGSGTNQYHAAYGQVDMSARFKVTDNIQLFADAVNLTNANNYLYWGDNRPIQRSIDYRRFDLGVRFAWSPAPPPPPPPPAVAPPPPPPAPATQTCADGTVILATDTCPAPPPPPPPPPAPAPERGR